MALKEWYSGLSPFQKARVRLTGWYVMLFGVLIIGFTLMVLNARASSFVRVHRVVESTNPEPTQLTAFERQFEEFNRRFEQRIFVFDGILLAATIWLSYFLSGKTLEPIYRVFKQQEEFTGDVSHELRTPLTTMKLEIESILRTQGRVRRVIKQSYISLLEEVEHMHQIVSGLLMLVRVDNPEIQIDRQTVNLVEMAALALEKRQLMAKTKRQRLILDDRRKQVRVRGYQEQLFQLLIILLDNALKYSPEKATIRLVVERDRSNAIIRVINPGKDFSLQYKDQLFERFYRGEEGVVGGIKGTGLGLAIAKKIVDYHHGSIRVTKRESHLVVFTVQLPAFRLD